MSDRKVPFFEYPRLWLDNRKLFLSVIDETASSGGFIMHHAVNEFESELSDYVGSQYSLGVGNATDAMEIFLQAIGLQPEDEIIISSHTMLATASAIISAGGKPVPVDIGEDNLIDPDAVADAINSKTVGIMPTQLNGRTCRMDELEKIANQNGLFIVEDAAQALGSMFKGKSAGTFGLASCISFYPAKVLGSLGDAGAILTSDSDIYNKSYQIRDHGRDQEGEIRCWGRNSRLDNIQAAILKSTLPDYPSIIERRRSIASQYHEQLHDLDELRLPPPPSDGDHFDVYQNYELVASSRDELKEYLSSKGIGTLIQWGGDAIHHFKQLGFDQNLRKTDQFFEGCIMLPMNFFITDDDVNYISKCVRSFYRS